MVNILLIENQQTQFKKIRGILEDLGYNVYPKYKNGQGFVEFIDYARVWVNKDYDDNDKETYDEKKEYRNLAMKNIVSVINNDKNKIDVLLIDYKLGAGHKSQTGIDLAAEINTILSSRPLPIVFISKNREDEEEIEKKLEEYAKKKFSAYKWLHKGEFCEKLNREAYIKNNIKHVIDDLVKEKEESLENIYVSLLKEKLESDSHTYDFSDYINRFEKKGFKHFFNGSNWNERFKDIRGMTFKEEVNKIIKGTFKT